MNIQEIISSMKSNLFATKSIEEAQQTVMNCAQSVDTPANVYIAVQVMMNAYAAELEKAINDN